MLLKAMLDNLIEGLGAERDDLGVIGETILLVVHEIVSFCTPKREF